MCSEHLLYAYAHHSFPFLGKGNSIFLRGTPLHQFQAFLVGLSAMGTLPPIHPQRVGTGPQIHSPDSLLGNLNLEWSPTNHRKQLAWNHPSQPAYGFLSPRLLELPWFPGFPSLAVEHLLQPPSLLLWNRYRILSFSLRKFA